MVVDIRPKTNFSLRPIQQRVCVTFDYEVHFTNGLFDIENPLVAQIVAASTSAKQAIAVVDAGLLEHHPQLPQQIAAYTQQYNEIVRLATDPVIVPGGEAAKNDPQLIEKIQQAIDAVGLCRHSYVIGIGGGAVLDMVGYAAATAHRGVRLIRVPTTVLAQNDSGVGVKNGINAFGKKNF